jgi:hypothetical protein
MRPEMDTMDAGKLKWQTQLERFTPNIVQVIKSRRIGWAGHVASTGERCVQGFSGEMR